ncbi:MAG: carbohydrate porin [Gemmatimonadetes bacterium]|nr:carbohydrate porin [Gemmatimonadota bacterium]
MRIAFPRPPRCRAGAVAVLAAGLALAAGARDVRAQGAGPNVSAPSLLGIQLLGAQLNIISQYLAPFDSPYAGTNSLVATGDLKTSHAYGAYLGARLGAGFSAYVDLEMIRGEGVGHVLGLGGLTNGDVIRQGSADLGSGPYIARIFLKYTTGIGAERDTLARAQDQVAEIVPSRRLEVVAGLLAVTDLFDQNRYANTTRHQFMNWGLFQNTAWDFAADTRGYSNGVAVSLISPQWTMRGGVFQMPTRANGNEFDSKLGEAFGVQGEVQWTSRASGTVLRGLAFLNSARMGNYDAALAATRPSNAPPDVTANDRPGRRKYGVGLNIEQPLADSGETGLFARIGWSDGRNESFAFTEVDRHVSVGVQVSGARWGRDGDRLGIAAVDHGLSHEHRDYLAAGGLGFLLGDGKLTYGDERIFEAYYRFRLGSAVEVGPDLQLIENPGYNQDRGPAAVLSLRLNLRY